MPAQLDFRNPVAAAVWWACITELKALKPGNVSAYSDGHGMQVSDFVTSARAITPILANPKLSLGERILHAVQATQAQVGCNTNLGIILLCAPLAHSALAASETHTTQIMHSQLTHTLNNLSIDDAKYTLRAIQLAAPAGLGRVGVHDVATLPSANLLAIMRSAAQRDRIAYQYAHAYVDIFETGLPTLSHALQRWQKIAWATAELYLNFLTRFADTHIQRKLGHATANAVRRDAAQLLELMEASDQPEQVSAPLLAFDANLKQKGINPGTSADLSVATLFVYRLQSLQSTL